MDWSGCPLVEQVPGILSGVPVVKGHRVQVGSIVENHESGSSLEEIAETFDIPLHTIQQILSYADAHKEQLHA